MPLQKSAVGLAIGGCTYSFVGKGMRSITSGLFRIYREEGLHVRRRGGRKRAIGTRAPAKLPLLPNQRWSLDFVSDHMTDGRRFRILTVVDVCTRECLALIADTSLSGARVARELGSLFETRGKPVTIVSDNVLGQEEFADLGTRSQGSRMHDCLHRIAQAGSAVKKWSLP